MRETDITLNHLFDLKRDAETNRWFMSVDSTTPVISIKETISKEIQTLEWSTISHQIHEKIHEILDINLIDVMIMAWTKTRLLRKHLNEDSSSHDNVVITLSEHTIKSTHHPYIEVLINGRSIGKVTFEISVYMIINGAILTIKLGKIKKINIGSLKAGCSIKCSGYTLVEKQTPMLLLPGEIDLDKPGRVGKSEALPTK